MEAVSLSFVFFLLLSPFLPLTVTWFSTVVEQDAIIRTESERVLFPARYALLRASPSSPSALSLFAILSDKALQEAASAQVVLHSL